jgi:hypothetical protein
MIIAKYCYSSEFEEIVLQSQAREAIMQIIHQVKHLSASPELLGLALIAVVLALVGGACLVYRIVMQGMRSGKEMRLGSWFWWKK